MKVLCFGLGSIGKRHLRVLGESTPLNVLWCPSGVHSVAPEIEGAKNVHVCRTLDEALAKEPDFAIISNPTSKHVSTAIELAERGIPFLLEKPVSDSLEGLDRLTQMVEAKKSKILVGYNFRYHPAYKMIKHWIQEGRIGAPLSLISELGQWLPDWHPDKDYRIEGSAKAELGGGVVLDLSHEIDLAVDLFGAVDKVSAVCGQFSSLDIETEDIAEITLIHMEKRLSHIHVDYCQRTHSKSLKIIGEDATIQWDYTENCVRLIGPKGQLDIWNGAKDYTRDDMYKAQMQHWLSVISGESEPEVSLQQGVYVAEIALAAKQSSREECAIQVDQMRCYT